MENKKLKLLADQYVCLMEKWSGYKTVMQATDKQINDVARYCDSNSPYYIENEYRKDRSKMKKIAAKMDEIKDES